MKATRPLEYVCFFPIEFPTKEGDVYFFTCVDAYSEFVFQTGAEPSNDNQAVLKHIKLLMENTEFKKHREKGFTLVVHKYKEIQNEIEAIIKPYGGKMIIDDLFVTQKITPVIVHLYKSLPTKK
jgi:hypothetical protein